MLHLRYLEISCSSLEAPTNGHMVCDNGFRYMSQCVFECLPGYEKVSSTRKESGVTTCKVDGSWQGIIPKCKSKSQQLTNSLSLMFLLQLRH